MEKWKIIKGYEGRYLVSSLGNIKSLKRRIEDKNGKIRGIKERILKQTVDSAGYYFVCLLKNGDQSVINVHRLVAGAFIGMAGKNMVVNHINFDKLDNRLVNLEIITARENTNKKHLKSSSKYTGVWLNKNKGQNSWGSRIFINGKPVYLGSFKIEIEAHYAYQRALEGI